MRSRKLGQMAPSVRAAVLVLSVIAATTLVGVSPAAAAHGDSSSTAATNKHKTPSPPVVTTSPTRTAVALGKTAHFTAKASGYPKPKVEWQRSTNGIDFVNISHAKNLKVKTTRSTFGNRYRAVFSNSLGTAITAPALLAIVPTAACGRTPVPGINLSGCDLGGLTYSATAAARLAQSRLTQSGPNTTNDTIGGANFSNAVLTDVWLNGVEASGVSRFGWIQHARPRYVRRRHDGRQPDR